MRRASSLLSSPPKSSKGLEGRLSPPRVLMALSILRFSRPAARIVWPGPSKVFACGTLQRHLLLPFQRVLKCSPVPGEEVILRDVTSWRHLSSFTTKCSGDTKPQNPFKSNVANQADYSTSKKACESVGSSLNASNHGAPTRSHNINQT